MKPPPISLLGVALLALAGGVVGGCDEKPPERTEKFQPSTPPPGLIEEKLRARENAPKPGRPANAPTNSPTNSR